MRFECVPFHQLSPRQLYAIIHLRNEVFVVEQQCIFQDADYKDQDAHHLMAWNNDQLTGYTRLLPPGLTYAEMSIGRVVTSPAWRRSGIGKKLMQESIDRCYGLFGEGPIRIGAQQYLKAFYESFGFIQQGDGYLEDGIPHIYMLKA